jgi:hypothetical protein
MQQKSALLEFHHYRKLGIPDAHEVGFGQQNNDKEFKIELRPCSQRCWIWHGRKNMGSKSGRKLPVDTTVLKQPA